MGPGMSSAMTRCRMATRPKKLVSADLVSAHREEMKAALAAIPVK